MTRVIHTGDTHIGYRQYHVPERREDFLSAFRLVAEDAVEEGVDAVVHAGDLFHDRRPDLGDIMGTLSVLRTLADADVPFLAVVGNHEGKRDAQWLDLFESLGLARRLGSEPVVLGDTAFYGLDFVPRSQREGLDYEFAPTEADHAALVAHGLFQPFEFGDWDAAEVLEAAPVDFDAMLLGDNHDPGKKEVDGTWVTYCGSTERASADEREERGYNIVEFDDGVRISRRGLPTREFVFVDVSLGEGEGVARVRERVGQHDLEDAVVVVSIAGEGEPVTPAEVESFAREEGALVARVTDEREFDREHEVSVSFADPDEAVRERVRELGLSPAARDLDGIIRASKVPDSKVADEVQSRVAELVEEGGADAFAAAGPVEDDEPDSDGESPPDAEAVDGDDARETGDAGAAGERRAEADDEGREPAAESAESAASGSDAQSTMGEYL